MTDEVIKLLIRSLECKFYPIGSTITQYGEIGSAFNIILRGGVYILVPKTESIINQNKEK